MDNRTRLEIVRGNPSQVRILYPPPRFMAKTFIQRFAQKGIVINSDGQILLIRYSAAKYQAKKIAGKYALPGGKVEVGESPDQSLVNEIKEETGVLCKPGMPIYVWNWEYDKEDDRVQINAVARICRYIEGEIVFSRKDNESIIEGVYWVEKRKVMSLPLVEDEKVAVEVFLANSDFAKVYS